MLRNVAEQVPTDAGGRQGRVTLGVVQGRTSLRGQDGASAHPASTNEVLEDRGSAPACCRSKVLGKLPLGHRLWRATFVADGPVGVVGVPAEGLVPTPPISEPHLLVVRPRQPRLLPLGGLPGWLVAWGMVDMMVRWGLPGLAVPLAPLLLLLGSWCCCFLT